MKEVLTIVFVRWVVIAYSMDIIYVAVKAPTIDGGPCLTYFRASRGECSHIRLISSLCKDQRQ